MTESLDPEVEVPRNFTTQPSDFPAVLQNFVKSIQSGSFEDSIGVRVRQRAKRVCSELCGCLLLSMVASGPTCSSQISWIKGSQVPSHALSCVIGSPFASFPCKDRRLRGVQGAR